MKIKDISYLLIIAMCLLLLETSVRGGEGSSGANSKASRSGSGAARSRGKIGANVPVAAIDPGGKPVRGVSAEDSSVDRTVVPRDRVESDPLIDSQYARIIEAKSDKARSHSEEGAKREGVAALLPRFSTLDGASTTRMIETVVVFGLVSLAPAALLMITAFVRISIVLTLLRQALGNPQIPGNQVLTALALLLTAIVMRPAVTRTYQDAIEPLAAGKIAPARAWEIGVKPIKAFMIDQIFATHRQAYLVDFYRYVNPDGPKPTDCDSLPMRVVAPAFLIAELTTALLIGFAIYLPFLVIDLVVSAVLAAMGMFMLPPAQVSAPLKLIVFVLADGWRLVADMLIRSFAPG